MIAPGIPKKVLEKFGKEDTKIIQNHIEEAKKVIRQKKNLLDGNVEELNETIKSPQSELDQLLMLAREVEKENVDIAAGLLGLEVDVRSLMDAIELEIKMLSAIEKESHEEEPNLQKEMKDEVILGRKVEHQLNLTYTIQKLSAEIIGNLKTLEPKTQERVGGALENINGIAAYIGNLIIQEELPHLQIIYSTLRLEEWPSIQSRIVELQSQFENINTSTKLL